MAFSLNRTLDAGKGLLFGSGGKSSNAYKAPDLDFLRQSAPAPDYSFLRDYATTAGGLADRGKSYLDYLTPTGARADVQNASLQNTLSNIERDTKDRFGVDIMEKYARGLIGGGAQSDIAANSLAQIATGAGRTAADAYTSLADKNLDYATNAANSYNQLMGQGASLEGNLLQSYASSLGSNASQELQRRIALANALNGQASAYASAERPGNYGMLGTFADSFADSAGQGAAAYLTCFLPDTEVDMADGSTKMIAEVQPGDLTRGGIVLETRKSITDDLRDYNGVMVSGSHCVFHDGSWQRVGATGAHRIGGRHIVHNIVVSQHRIYIKGFVFDDAMEFARGAGHLDILNALEAVHA